MQVLCGFCGKEFERKQLDKRMKSVFCSRSCAAKMNNKLHPKRKLSNECLDCKKKINNCSKRCKDCHYKIKRPVDESLITIDDTTYRGSRFRSNQYVLIREKARAKAKKLGWNSCKKCNYSKHIQIAHIKSIKSFDPQTPLSVVNDESNLCPLCPNCHWELDHGLWTL